MASFVTNRNHYLSWTGTNDLVDDDHVVLLATSSASPAITWATYQSLITDTNEASGTGYTQGTGVALAGEAVTEESAEAKFDATDTVFSTVTLTNVRYAVIVKGTGPLNSTDPILFIIDLGQDLNPVAGDLTIQWNASGIAGLAQA